MWALFADSVYIIWKGLWLHQHRITINFFIGNTLTILVRCPSRQQKQKKKNQKIIIIIKKTLILAKLWTTKSVLHLLPLLILEAFKLSKFHFDKGKNNLKPQKFISTLFGRKLQAWSKACDFPVFAHYTDQSKYGTTYLQKLQIHHYCCYSNHVDFDYQNFHWSSY